MTDEALDLGIEAETAASPRGVLAAIGGRLRAERDRWSLWLPVGFGLGAAIYLALTVEPWPGLGAVVAGPAMVLAWYATGLRRILLVGVALVASGFAAAQIETSMAGTVMLDRLLPATEVSGRVVDLDPRPEGLRVTIAPERIDKLAGPLLGAVRVRLRHEVPVEIGDRIRLKATLLPDPGPAVPGGFDFQRQAYFSGLGAVGYALGEPAVTPGRANGWRAAIRSLREAMAARLRAGLPGDQGAIVAAMVTGERGAIPPSLNEAYRNAGLAHLLVIAGLHMSLVTGFVFVAVRAGLALVPALALRFPIKKWAAGAAWAAALFYLVISGAAVPTERAFVMVSLGLGAILVDRLPFSMRGLAIAAWIVLIVDPVAVAGVSFEMSFAAVAALIAFYEAWGTRLAELARDRGIVGRAGFHLLGIALTTVMATIGTAGFTIYHFNRFALYSVLANLVAVPLAAVWIMPWAVTACLLMPFGLERLALVPLGWGLDLVDVVARWSAGLPGAVLDFPAMPVWGLVLIAFGGLWLAIWRTSWRRWGLAAIAAGLLALFASRPADILLAEDGRLVALRTASGYLLSSDRADRVSAETWLRQAGGGQVEAWPAPGAASGDGTLRCDPDACLWRPAGRIVSVIRGWSAFDEDCRRAEIVVATVSAPPWCRDHALVIDRAFARREGATALWLGDRPLIETAGSARGTRPWVVRPGPYRADPVSSAEEDPPDGPAP